MLCCVSIYSTHTCIILVCGAWIIKFGNKCIISCSDGHVTTSKVYNLMSFVIQCFVCLIVIYASDVVVLRNNTFVINFIKCN